MADLKTFRDDLLKTIQNMDGVTDASLIEDTDSLAIGVEPVDGELFFVEIQPA